MRGGVGPVLWVRDGGGAVGPVLRPQARRCGKQQHINIEITKPENFLELNFQCLERSDVMNWWSAKGECEKYGMSMMRIANKEKVDNKN